MVLGCQKSEEGKEEERKNEERRTKNEKRNFFPLPSSLFSLFPHSRYNVSKHTDALLGLSRFRRFGEPYLVMQAESGLPLVNPWLKPTYMRTTSYLLLVSA